MGEFAEYVVVPACIAHTLPDSISFQETALIQAVSVPVHAILLTPRRRIQCFRYISLADDVVRMWLGVRGYFKDCQSVP